MRTASPRLCLFMLWWLVTSTALCAAPNITSVLKQAPVLNPNLSTFPESSLVDRSASLEAPAGKCGFVTVKNGHFTYADGTRARFFGVNLAKNTVFIEKPQIDRLVDLFARSGINLVRIHHIDDTEGILDPDPKNFFRKDKLDLVDYWVARLKARGIYVCLDLNDYRTFRASEGVENGEQLGRGAKPYAVFDQRLIELQMEYAQRFLVDHINPYTRLCYAKDPAVAFLEIYDENGLFIRRSDWPALKEPYKTEFLQNWNAWLRYRYGSTKELKCAWTDRTGYCALTAAESLEDASVQLPNLALDSDLPQNITDPLRAPTRIADGVQFAYEMQVNYLRVMMAGLRDIGVKIPITAVGAQDIMPDLKATADATDYIGINYYWDHPTWNPGKEWTLPSYFSLKNPLSDNQDFAFTSVVSLARIHEKPLVVRELGYCFPNPYRGVGTLEAAAYGAFLDLDALILFTYDAYASARTIGYFDIHLDPLRWGLVAEAARLFLSGEVKPAKTTVGIGYSDLDAFTWYQYGSPLYQLGSATRVVNYLDMERPNPLNLLITSGRSSGTAWPGNRILFFANQRHADLHFQQTVDALEEQYGYQLQTGRGGVFDFTFRGMGYDKGTQRSAQSWPTFSVADLTTKGYTPIATSDMLALGFVDSTRKMIGFRNLRGDLASRIALDALRDWDKAPISHADIDQGCWRSDTGQLSRDLANGLLRVNTPTMQAIAGKLDAADGVRVGAFKLSTSSGIGTLTVESLDGKALGESGAILLKMTTRARNDMVKMAVATDGPKPHRLTSLGIAPILTDGKAAATPTRVEMDGKLLLELFLQNGTWEYLIEANRALLYLDAGDITINLPQRPALVRWHTGTEIIDFTPADTQLTVPSGVRYTEIIWAPAK